MSACREIDRVFRLPVIFIIPFIFGCNQTPAPIVSGNKTEQASNESNDEKPIENGLAFLNSYVENCNRMKESKGVFEWVDSNQFVTANFKTELKKIMAISAEPDVMLESDPIFDAQDYPSEGFELDSFDQKSNYLVVKGKNWPEFKLSLKIALEKDEWLVDGCGIINIPENKRIPR